MKEINWKKSNFLKSKLGNLIVVNTPSSKKDTLEFEGIILNADESEHNAVLMHSNNYKKAKFELLNPEEITVNFTKK